MESKEKEKEKEVERERREMELECALYSNCLLLGLDPAILGTNRAGLFRHSNPKLGENLLHFVFCAIRGPGQSAKDFAGVWPIFDASQSRDFRKIVQGLINDLETQGALPRNNSRVSSLATCCGQRFVELLWQLSAHALREVHKRVFPNDVAANQIPASLTDIMHQSSHASALLAVTKARIALERRQFLEDAVAVVHKQSLWSSLAQDLTSEFRGLSAEEAYLQQELGKAQDTKVCKAKLNDGVNVGFNITDLEKAAVARMSYLWESLLHHLSQHEKLSSGPIEDLLSNREHRYRISGATLCAALQHGSSKDQMDCPSATVETAEQIDKNGLKELQSTRQKIEGIPILQTESQELNQLEENNSKLTTTIDVAEVLRRWTHSLQQIHKQSLRLARSNGGSGPELLRSDSKYGGNGHAESMKACLAEHRQHFANLKNLVAQLKTETPTLESSVAALHEEVSKIVISDLKTAPRQESISDLEGQHLKEERKEDIRFEEKLPQNLWQRESSSLKLPQLFDLSSDFTDKCSFQEKDGSTTDFTGGQEGTAELEKGSGTSLAKTHANIDISAIGRNLLRQSVRDAVLQRKTCTEQIKENTFQKTEHYFIPVSSNCNFMNTRNDLFAPKAQKVSKEYSLLKENFDSVSERLQPRDNEDIFYDCESHLSSEQQWNGYLEMQRFCGTDMMEEFLTDFEYDARDDLVRPFSPPLLMELSSFPEAYENLLAPISEGDAALMECSLQTMHA